MLFNLLEKLLKFQKSSLGKLKIIQRFAALDLKFMNVTNEYLKILPVYVQELNVKLIVNFLGVF